MTIEQADDWAADRTYDECNNCQTAYLVVAGIAKCEHCNGTDFTRWYAVRSLQLEQENAGLREALATSSSEREAQLEQENRERAAEIGRLNNTAFTYQDAFHKISHEKTGLEHELARKACTPLLLNGSPVLEKLLSRLEWVDTVKLAACGLPNEAMSIGKTRVLLDQLIKVRDAKRAECGGYYCDESIGHIDCEGPAPLICAHCSAVLDPVSPYIEAGYKNLRGVRPGLVPAHAFCDEQCVVAKYQAEALAAVQPVGKKEEEDAKI